MLLLKLQRLFAKSEFLSNVAKLTGGTMVAQLIAVLASPVLARLFSPAAFGAFAIYNSLVLVLLVIATGRYDLGIIIARKKVEAVHLVALSFIFLSGVSVLVGVALLTMREQIEQWTNIGDYAVLLYLVPLSLFLSGAYQILGYWSNRSKNFQLLAVSKVAQSSVNSGGALFFRYFEASGIGLILANVMGLLVAFLILIRQHLGLLATLWNTVNVRRLRHTLRKHRDFPVFSLPTALMDTISFSLPVFLLTHFFSGAITGQFSLGYRILSMPLTLVGISIGQVFYQRLAETYNRQGNAWKLITRTWESLFLIGLLPTLTLLFFAPPLFSLIFGPEWEQAGSFASILALPMFLSFCSSPTSTAFIVFRMQHLSFLFGFLALVLRPLAFYAGYLQQDVLLSFKIWAVVDISLLLGFNFLIYRKASHPRIKKAFERPFPK